MKYIFYLLVIVLSSVGYGQVGIGTEVPETSLDVRAENHLGDVSTNDGVLVPRVISLSNNGSTNGQLVFLDMNWTDDQGTTTTNDDFLYENGFFYWNTSTALWTPIGKTIEPWFRAETTEKATLNTDNIYTSGLVGIGTDNPLGALHITTTNPRDVLMFRFIDAANDDLDIDLFRSRGTLAAPSLLLDNTRLGGLRAQSITNATSTPIRFRPSAEIYFQTDGASSATSSAGEINFATTPSGATSTFERMVIQSDGDVGIGTSDPQDRLHIDGGSLRITDGTEDEGKVLTSNADGTGSWEFTSITHIVGDLGAGVDIPVSPPLGPYLQTGSSITLPPGRYVVNVLMTVASLNASGARVRVPITADVWLRSSFSDSNVPGSPISPDIQGGELVSGNHGSNAIFSILSGFIIIENTTATDKTYHYVAGNCESFNTTMTLTSFGGTTWGENNIVAYRIE